MKKSKGVGTFFTVPVIIAILILGLIAISSIFAPLITTYDPVAVDMGNALAGFSAEHILGTDAVGRDQFTRLLYGARTSLLNAFLVICISIAVGVPLGLICGYYRGKVDAVIMKLWDFILSFPSLLLAFVLVAAFGRGASKAVIATGIIYIPMLSKLTRSICMTEKKKVYVEACKSLGYFDMRILFGHILKNCIPMLMAEITLDFGYAIMSLASLSFLGLGVQAPTADWGSMLEEGLQYLLQRPLSAMIPAIAIVITITCVNILADGIQMYLDPDQRKLPSFKKLERKLKGRRLHGNC